MTVDPNTLAPTFPGIYAVGDLASTGVRKAGVYAEGAARTVAANILSVLRGQDPTARNPRRGVLLHRIRRRTHRAGGR